MVDRVRVKQLVGHFAKFAKLALIKVAVAFPQHFDQFLVQRHHPVFLHLFVLVVRRQTLLAHFVRCVVVLFLHKFVHFQVRNRQAEIGRIVQCIFKTQQPFINLVAVLCDFDHFEVLLFHRRRRLLLTLQAYHAINVFLALFQFAADIGGFCQRVIKRAVARVEVVQNLLFGEFRVHRLSGGIGDGLARRVILAEQRGHVGLIR
mmetsp:Transcript_24813/g.39409  ORF Transcript_24813/g.39409 Transcript_24813/m.39409 type:complete len:204 (+) Transcript_24813:1221-1832(+)